MQCTNCGKELANDDTFCSNCGVAVKNVAMPEGGVTTNVQPEPVVQIETAQTLEQAQTQAVQPVTLTPPAAAPIETAQVEPVIVAQPTPVHVDAPSVAPAPEVQQTVVEQQVVEQPVVEQTAAPAPEEETKGNPAVAQVMGSEFAAKQEDDNVIPSGGINYGPAPIVDPPAMSEMTVTAPPLQAPPKKGGFPVPAIIAIAIVAFVGLLGGGIFVGTLIAGGSNVEKPGKIVDVGKRETVTFGGATFNIPTDNYEYELSSGKLAIFNDDIYFYIMIAPMGYTQYNNNIPYLKNYYSEQGYLVESGTEKRVGDQRYVVLDMQSATGKVTLFIRPFNSSNSLTGAIAKTQGDYATAEDLEIVESILKTNKQVSRAAGGDKITKIDDEVLNGIIDMNIDNIEPADVDTNEPVVEDAKTEPTDNKTE